jgi:hypothetical protein
LSSASGISTPEPNARLFRALHVYCEVTAIMVVGLACVVLCGWALDHEILKTVVPGLVTMKANTAVALALCSVSLWLLLPEAAGISRRAIAMLLGLTVALIGAATLCEYLFGVNLQIDQILFRDLKG